MLYFNIDIMYYSFGLRSERPRRKIVERAYITIGIFNPINNTVTI